MFRTPRTCSSTARRSSRLIFLGFVTAAAALSLDPAPVSAARPVDDFEIGAFAYQSAGTFVDESDFLGPPIHVISNSRRVQLYSQDGVAAVSLTPGTSLDDETLFTVLDGGYCKFIYDLSGPQDLTDGGAIDRIRLRLGAGIIGAHIQVTIQTTAAVQSRILGVPGAGAQFLDFLLDDFTSLNPEQATDVSVTFLVPGAEDGAFLIRGIDLTGPLSLPYYFEPIFEAIVTPPVPTPPLRFVMGVQEQSLFEVGVPLVDVRDVAGAVPAVRATWTNAPHPAGDIAGIFLTRAGIEPQPFLQTTLVMGVQPEPFLVGLAEVAIPPDAILVENRSFRLQFAITVRDDRGAAVGTSNVALFGDIAEGTALEFLDVAVDGQERGLRGGPFAGLQLTFSVKPTGSIDVDAPLVDLSWVADWAPAAATGFAEFSEPGSNDKTIRLTAAPSVTQQGARLLVDRPFDPGARLEIFDVAGRSIRRLHPVAGAREVAWDGGDDSGRAVPGGVYFVRVAGDPGAGTRIVKIR